MPDGRCVQFTLKNDEFTDDDFHRPQFKRGLDLLASSETIPPTYKDDGTSLVLSVLMVDVYKVCTIEVDLHQLPRAAFSLREGPRRSYYHVEYQLGVTFGSLLEFKLMWDGKVYGEASSRYS
jgi:hypothetical protein